MPITTSETKTITIEKYMSRIDIQESAQIINIEVRYRWIDGDSILTEKFYNVPISGSSMAELAGIYPRLEVPSGKSYYEAVRDRCYDYLTEKGLWPLG